MEEKRKAMEEEKKKEIVETYNHLKATELDAKACGNGELYFMASNQAVGAMRVIQALYDVYDIHMDDDGVYITRLGD